MSNGTCSDCPFHHVEDGVMWCRRFPPTFYERISVGGPPLVLDDSGMIKPGIGKPEISKDMASSFPPVLRDWWCGEHPTRRAWAELKAKEGL